MRLGDVEGRPVKSVNGFVNILRPGESPHEKQPGFVFGTIQSDHEQVVKIACNADWWMEVRLNSELICSTMEKGNEGKVLTERVLDLPLKKGGNLLAVKVLSGKGGWSVTFASPAELPGLLDPRQAGNCIDLALETGGKEVACERLTLQPVWRVPLLGGFPWETGEESWLGAKPDFALESANVTSFFDKLPDSTKFWSGNRDLSAEGWMRCDDRRLYLFLRVLDNNNVPGADPAELAEMDSLQIGIAKDGTTAFDLYRIGQMGNAEVIRKEAPSLDKPGSFDVVPPDAIAAHIARAEGATFYRIAMDRRLVGDGIFRFNLLVNDNDDGYRKQFITWSSGLGLSRDSSLWQSLILTEPGTVGRRQ
jgi:hypothetical protein